MSVAKDLILLSGALSQRGLLEPIKTEKRVTDIMEYPER